MGSCVSIGKRKISATVEASNNSVRIQDFDSISGYINFLKQQKVPQISLGKNKLYQRRISRNNVKA